MSKSQPKSQPTSPPSPDRTEAPSAPLTGSRSLLLAAWIALAIWLVLLSALAAHVVGWW